MPVTESDMKTTITPEEQLQLVGLLALADRHSRMLNEIHRAVVALLHIPAEDESGHVMDAIYDDGRRHADQLLERLGVSVGDTKQAVGNDSVEPAKEHR